MNIKSEIIDKLDRPIVLVGMMGAGKSLVGQILSKELGLALYDSDEIIEQAQGMSVADIFNEKGEAFFRKLEADTIINILDERRPCILSTGGGAVINPTVLNAIKEYAFSIWLMSDVSTILNRIGHDTKRPLLAVSDREKRLQELLRVRKPLYAQADIKIDNSDKDESVLRSNLIQALYEFLNLR